MLIGARVYVRHAVHTHPPRLGQVTGRRRLSQRFKVREFCSVSLLSAADRGAHRKHWLDDDSIFLSPSLCLLPRLLTALSTEQLQFDAAKSSVAR